MDWDPEFLTRSPMFEPLREHAPRAFPPRWPDLAVLQLMLERRAPPVQVATGLPLRVVPQAVKPVVPEERYEARVYLRGELQVRSRNWHDLLNVLVWLAFPRAKAALNARHYAALSEQLSLGAKNRGPAQDALTLFDEGGVVAAAADVELLDLLHACEWKELFRRRRAAIGSRIGFYLFGHALYEKALRPFVGVTGRAILLQVELGLLREPRATLLAQLDSRIAEVLADPARCSATRELAPVPILGVPGWCADNEHEAYYDNLDYFRPKKA